MKKTLTSKIVIGLLTFFASLLLINSLGQKVLAAGCYTAPLSVDKVACGSTSGVNDAQGNPVDTSSNCYLVGTSNGATTFSKEDCGSIDTPSNYCGGAGQAVSTSIDLGCSHQGNPITDMLFAIIRLLSDGVGIVIVASVVVAGIQYTVSRGEPQATAAAMTRVQSAFTALLIFIFGWALLQWLLPGGIF